jgi:hypothetical protein
LGAVYPYVGTLPEVVCRTSLEGPGPNALTSHSTSSSFYTIAFQGEISHPNILRKLPGEARLRFSLKAHASQVTRYAISHTVIVRALVVSVCCIDERIRSCRKKARPGTTGLLYPFNDDSFLAPGNNQRDGDLKLTLVSVGSSRFARHEAMQYISLLSARPSGYIYLSITLQC